MVYLRDEVLIGKTSELFRELRRAENIVAERRDRSTRLQLRNIPGVSGGPRRATQSSFEEAIDFRRVGIAKSGLVVDNIGGAIHHSNCNSGAAGSIAE